MNKKSLMLLGILAAVVAAYFIFSRNMKSTMKPELTDFAVKDIDAVDKIFISMNNNTGNALLTKQTNGIWRINNKYDVNPAQINELLEVIKNVEVKNPVSEATMPEVIRNLTLNGKKVEIYQHGDLVKTYYVGGTTPDMLGTLMYLKGSNKPFACHLPGFNGYLSSHYMTNEADWRSKTVFAIKSDQVAKIILDWKEAPQKSFEIDQTASAPAIRPLAGNTISNVNMNLLRSYLNMWENLCYDGFPGNLTPKDIDSIAKTRPFLVITITDKEGKTRKLTIHHKGVQVDTYTKTDELGNPMPYEVDNFYAFIDGNTKEVVQIQDFVFGKVMKGYQDFIL